MSRWLVGLLLLNIVELSTLHASDHEEEVQELQGVTRQVENLTLTPEPFPTMRPSLLPDDPLYQPKALIERIQQNGGLTSSLIQEFYETYKGYRDCGSLWWDAFSTYKQEDDLKSRFFCPNWMPDATVVHMTDLTEQWFHRPQSLEEHQRWHPYAACLFMAVVYNYPQALNLWEHLRVLPTQQAQVLKSQDFIRNQAMEISRKVCTNRNILGRIQEMIGIHLDQLNQQAEDLQAFPNHFTQMALSAQDIDLEAYENYLNCLSLFVGKRLENQAAYVVIGHRDARWMVYTPLHFFKDNGSDLKTQVEPQHAIALSVREGEMVGYLQALREKVAQVIANDQDAITGLIHPELYLHLIDGFNFNYYLTRCAAWQHFSINGDKETLREVYQARLKVEQFSFDLLNQASDFKALKIHEMLTLHNNLWDTSGKIAQNQDTDGDKLPWIEITLDYMRQALAFRQQTSRSLQEKYQLQRGQLNELQKQQDELRDQIIDFQLSSAIDQQDSQQPESTLADREVQPQALEAQQKVVQETHELFTLIKDGIPPLEKGILALKNRHADIVSNRHFRQPLSPLKELPRH